MTLGRPPGLTPPSVRKTNYTKPWVRQKQQRSVMAVWLRANSVPSATRKKSPLLLHELWLEFMKCHRVSNYVCTAFVESELAMH